MLLQHHHSRVCRKKHKCRVKAHNALAQRVFKTAHLYAVTNPQPTASGSMPVTAIYGTKHYAIQSDHLNTPRRLIQSDGQVAWQWAYSAFGDEQPTIASNRFANTALNQSFGTTSVPAVTFNLRYPGQYFDQESNLHYNYHRSYSATVGRYTQSDPIGLDGGVESVWVCGAESAFSNIDNVADIVGDVTGGSNRINHPSVGPTIIFPERPGQCSMVCNTTGGNSCRSNDGCQLVCGPKASQGRGR